MKPVLERFPDAETMSRAAARLVAEAARKAIAERGRFSLALSGGRTPRRLYELLAGSSLPWDKLHLFWGDERCVPKTDPRSNYHLALETLLGRAAVPPQNIHAMPVEIGSPEAAAKAYEEELRGFFRGAVTFDLVLLGMGPDGHTASLFPGAPALSEEKRWVVGVDGKQGDPPVPRLTLTLAAINASRAALFLVSGGDKKPVVEKIMAAGASCPAAMVSPSGGAVWYACDA